MKIKTTTCMFNAHLSVDEWSNCVYSMSCYEFQTLVKGRDRWMTADSSVHHHQYHQHIICPSQFLERKTISSSLSTSLCLEIIKTNVYEGKGTECCSVVVRQHSFHQYHYEKGRWGPLSWENWGIKVEARRNAFFRQVQMGMLASPTSQAQLPSLFVFVTSITPLVNCD